MAFWYWCPNHGYLERIDFSNCVKEEWEARIAAHQKEHASLSLPNCWVAKVFRDSKDRIIQENRLIDGKFIEGQRYEY